MQNQEALESLIIKAVKVNSQGLTHVELVKSVLKTGYKHPGGNLSQDLMKLTRHLCKKCVIRKNLETRELAIV